MEVKEGIALQEKFVNIMEVGGELGSVIKEFNGSTGTFWTYTPDNSGVYELVEETKMHPSVKAVGVSGLTVWKFKAIKAGKGSIMFQESNGTKKHTIKLDVKN